MNSFYCMVYDKDESLSLCLSLRSWRMRDFIAALCTTVTRRVQYCAFPPIHVRPKDDDDEYDGDLLFRLYRRRVSADDVALRVCVRRLIHGRWTSLSLSPCARRDGCSGCVSARAV